MVASTMLKGGFSNRTLQYADVSSMTRTCAADSVMIHAPGFDHDRARRRGDVLLFIGTHARECRFGDAQFQEEIPPHRVVCDDPVRRRAMVTAVIPKLGTPAPLPVLTPP